MWAATTQHARPSDGPTVPVRLLLDTLGLGLEQTITLLGSERPEWDAFAAWIVATAGRPDPARLARWDAWCDGRPPPEAEVERQAAVMAADPVLTPDEMVRWDRDGVVVLPQAIGRDEAAAIADHLWATVGADPDDPSTWSRPRPGGIMVQQFQHPSMDVPRRSARVAKAFAQLHGHADLVASVDRLSLNPPERDGYTFPGPHLHWDTSLVPPIPFETQGILYLTDTAADQGALRVVPGFHHRLAAGWLDQVGGADEGLVALADEAVPVPADAGDLVIWRQEIPHGASANRSDRPRLAQYLTHHPLRRPDDRGWFSPRPVEGPGRNSHPV
ncbi:phytanoyl-CoA dioxygenase family protein [Iamia sp. SCSIO 61187]|nr:phytanoyl-CoA dioxygenase family protein [Iamia sp. SCSIO 61187]